MAALTWLGFGVFFVVALTTGIRLLLLARRTGELPELLVGLGVLGIGPVGFGLSTIGGQLVGGSVGHAISAASLLAVGVGAFAKFTFNWRVYHPESGVARAIVGVAAVVSLYAYGWGAVSGLLTGGASLRDLTVINSLRSLLLVSCLLWGSAEAIRYWLLMRRRLVLGLADPVVTMRFLLWGISAGAAGVGSAISNVAFFFLGAAPDALWVMMNSSMFGLIAAIGMWLAFLPPRSFLKRIRAGASS